MELIYFHNKECTICEEYQHTISGVVEAEGRLLSFMDCDENPHALDLFNIEGLPTVILFDESGNEIRRLKGMAKETRYNIARIIGFIREGNISG